MAQNPSPGAPPRLTSPDKLIFPDARFTKRDLADYLDAVADAFLPQLRDRPVTRVRFPDGVAGERLFQRHVGRGAPGWVRTARLRASPVDMGREASSDPGSSALVVSPVVDDRRTLAWMANQATVEFHTPQWRLGPRGAVRPPDRLVIDLDPGEGAGLDECARAARLVRAALAADGLDPVPVTSGGKGLHVRCALLPDEGGPRGRLPFARTAIGVHRYVRELAHRLAQEEHGLIVARAAKEDRVGRVFLDWSQNHPAKSTITPYSLRAKGPRPTVAAPRTWEEIRPGLAQLGPDQVLARLQRDGDLLAAPSIP